MTSGFWTAIVVVIAAGGAAALQAPVNATLGRVMESTLAAAAVSFGIGFLMLFAVSMLSGNAAAFGRLHAITSWHLLGGVLGAFYVWSMLWGVPTLGVVTAIAALILGQMVVALVIDTGGYFGLPQIELSATRIGAVVLVSAGLVLSRM